MKAEQGTREGMGGGGGQIATEDDLIMEVLQPPLSSVM